MFYYEPNTVTAIQGSALFTGHLAQDCFHMPGSSAYELLPDLDFMAQQEKQEQEASEKAAKKAKKKKKVKMHKQFWISSFLIL